MEGLWDRIFCKQDRQSTYTVTLRGVRATIFVEEKQCVLRITHPECV
jgi:hypothetical protein